MAITSAGFIGPDRPVPAEALRAALQRGIDLNEHRSTLVAEQAIDSAELIVVMDVAQKREVHRRCAGRPKTVVVLGDLDTQRIDMRPIPDPYGQPQEAFAAAYDRIDRCIDTLVTALNPVSNRAARSS